MYLIEKMRKTWLLLILVCCCHISIGEAVLPRTEGSNCRRLYQELGIRQTIGFPAFYKALENYHKYRSEKQDKLVVIDFTKPSTEKRFCVIDMQQKQVLFETYVSHGKNSGGNYATSFSNQPGSFKSSLGLFRTGETYYGKNGYSLVLEGLEKGINDKAKERAIVIHGASYADPALIPAQGRLGRSLGCPALPPVVSQKVIDTIKEGMLLYIYGNNKV